MSRASLAGTIAKSSLQPRRPPTPVKLTERSFARRIDLTSLQLFVAVCEAGSIGKAAEREFIAPSAVSKRLSDLEAALDTALLYRHARGVDLTPAGQSLLHHARSLLFGLEKMQGELSEYADGVRGHVRVHASISAIVQFLPEDLGTFVRRHPEVKVDLEEHLSSEVMRAVQEGAADLGICNVSAVTLSGAALQRRPYPPTGWCWWCRRPMRWQACQPWPLPTPWILTRSVCTPTAPSRWQASRRRRPSRGRSACAFASRGSTPCAA